MTKLKQETTQILYNIPLDNPYGQHLLIFKARGGKLKIGLFTLTPHRSTVSPAQWRTYQPTSNFNLYPGTYSLSKVKEQQIFTRLFVTRNKYNNLEFKVEATHPDNIKKILLTYELTPLQQLRIKRLA